MIVASLASKRSSRTRVQCLPVPSPVALDRQQLRLVAGSSAFSSSSRPRAGYDLRERPETTRSACPAPPAVRLVRSASTRAATATAAARRAPGFGRRDGPATLFQNARVAFFFPSPVRVTGLLAARRRGCRPPCPLSDLSTSSAACARASSAALVSPGRERFLRVGF